MVYEYFSMDLLMMLKNDITSLKHSKALTCLYFCKDPLQNLQSSPMLLCVSILLTYELHVNWFYMVSCHVCNFIMQRKKESFTYVSLLSWCEGVVTEETLTQLNLVWNMGIAWIKCGDHRERGGGRRDIVLPILWLREDSLCPNPQ